MSAIAATWVNWSAIGKIILAAVIGGSGVVVAFGLLLIGLKWATGAQNGSAKIGGITLAGLSALFCTAAVVFGIYAMVNKPVSKKPAPKKSAAVVIHAPARSGAAISRPD